MPIPPWVRFLISLGYMWPRIAPRPRRVAVVSMPCDSQAAALISLGAVVRDLGDPQANDLDAHYNRLLNYARQFLKHCKHCDVPCHPKVKQCGYTKQSTGRLRSPLLRGTVEISEQTDFDARELKWIQRSGRNGICTVVRKPEHLKDYHIEDEPPCEWNEAAGDLPRWPYEAMIEELTIIPDNLRRSFSGLCFAGRITGEKTTQEVCEQVRLGDTNCAYSLRQLLAIHGWSDFRISRMAYFNPRTRKIDRKVVPPSLVVADGDIAFLQAVDQADFQSSDIVGVVHRTMERDRLEAVGLKMQPDHWLAPDTNMLCELPSQPKGISIAILKSRNVP